MGLCKVKSLVFLCTHVLHNTYIPRKSCLIVKVICGFELGLFLGALVGNNRMGIIVVEWVSVL